MSAFLCEELALQSLGILRIIRIFALDNKTMTYEKTTFTMPIATTFCRLRR